MSWYRIGWYGFIWVVYGLLIKLPAVLLGLLMVPLALRFAEGSPKTWSGIFGLWGNREDGVPDWWLKRAADSNWFIQRFPNFWWLAIRNPANNLRYTIDEPQAVAYSMNGRIDMESTDLTPEKPVLRRWIYSRVLASYRRVWATDPGKYSEVYLGFKIRSSVPGVGFTVQWRRNREIGT